MDIQHLPADVSTGFLSKELSLRDAQNNPGLLASNFEAMFYRILFKEMREAEIGDPLFNSYEYGQMREMQDEEWAQSFGKEGHLGIKKLITDHLEQMQNPSIVHPGETEKLQGLLKDKQEAKL